MNHRTVDRLYVLLVLTHILFCYIACFSHQSAKLLLSNHSFLLTFDSFSDLLGQVVKMGLSLYTCISGLLLVTYSQIFTNLAIIVSSVLFVFSTIVRRDILYYVSWLLNRLSNGSMNYVRDMVIYRFSTYFSINIPFIKALKALGTVITLFHIYYLDLFGFMGIVLFGGASALCTVCGFLVCLYLNRANKLTCVKHAVGSHVVSTVIEKGAINDVNGADVGFIPNIRSKLPIFGKDFLFCILLVFVVGLSKISDQVIFNQGVSHKTAVLLKSFGQVVLGLAYAKLFRNSYYGVALIPAALAISYICFCLKYYYVLLVGISLFGLVITMTNSSVLVLASSLSTRSYLYPTILFCTDGLSSLIGSIMYDNIRLRFNYSKVLISYVMLSLCCLLLAIFICYLRRLNISKEMSDNCTSKWVS